MKNTFALEKYGRRLLLLAILLVIFGYGLKPVWHETKGPIWNGIRSPDNKYVRANQFADNLPGFRRGNIVMIELDFGRKVTGRDLSYVYRKTQELKARTGWNVISLATYHKAVGLTIEPYIPYYIEDVEEEFDISSWHEEVIRNPVVSRDLMLISKDLTRVLIYIVIPAEINELHAGRILWDAMEGVEHQTLWQEIKHELNWFFWKYDFSPKRDKNGPLISVFSHSGTFRPAINQGLERETHSKFPLGVVLFGGLLFLVPAFHFLAHLYIPLLISIVVSLVFTLGSIWGMHWFEIYRTAYNQIPLTVGFVVTLSMCLQKMEAYWNSRYFDRFERWREAGEKVHRSITFIALVTLLSFVIFTLVFSGVWRMVEMGVQFLSATLCAWGTAYFFLPALQLGYVRIFGEKTEESLRPWQLWVCRKIDRFFAISLRLITSVNASLYRNSRLRKWLACVPLAVFGAAVLLYPSVDKVTSPFTMLDEDMNVMKMARRANRPGGPGFEAYQVLIGMPDKPNAAESQTLYNAANELADKIRKSPNIRRVFVSLMGEAAFQLKHNTDLAEPRLRSAVQLVIDGENEIGLNFSSFLHNDRVIQLLAWHEMERSDKVRQGLNWIEDQCREVKAAYPMENIYCEPFGEIPFFPELAEKIPQQMPQNVILPLILVLAAYGGLVYSHTRNIRISISGSWILTQTLLVATGVTGCYMALAGVPLNMATAPISELAIAASADLIAYLGVAFLVHSGMRGLTPLDAMRNALAEKAEPSQKDWISNSLCFLLPAMSVFSPIADIGTLVILNLTVCALWGLLVVPAQLAAMTKRKEAGHEECYSASRLADSARNV